MLGIKSRRCALMGSSALAAALLLGPAIAGGTLPNNGKFVAGSGTIARGNGVMTINQSSTTGIIDWNSFSIGQKNSVSIDNGSGATLNRVTGGSASDIAGRLSGTGSIYLLNSNGVVVNRTGEVAAGGSFGASTGANMASFGKGNVAVSGIITARNVALSGQDVSVDGRVVAQGGHVWLMGGNSTSVTGSIDASNAAGRGGTIVATAPNVTLGKTANIDASGTKGGTVLIGGDVHGGANAADNFVARKISTAQTASVAKGARITANGSAGAGGHVVVWSDKSTNFSGAIGAQGKTKGGFVETSGVHLSVGAGAHVATDAASGLHGTWLLDPNDFTIAASGGDMTGADLSANLATTDVTIHSSDGATAGNGDIFVDDDVSWSSSHALALDAYHSISIHAPISVMGAGAVTLTTNDGGSGGDYDFGLGPTGFAGDIDFGSTNNGASLTINGITYALLYDMSGIASMNGSHGYFAQAHDINASSAGTYSTAVAGTLYGTFEGLGHSVSNLSIDSTTTQDKVGLIGDLEGRARDIDVVDANVVGGTEAFVGALAGYSRGTVTNAASSGYVEVGDSDSIHSAEGGGLIGWEDLGGNVFTSWSSADVVGGDANSTLLSVGGLIGYDKYAPIIGSYATGSVTVGDNNSEQGAEAGGLVGGVVHAHITGSYATGAVHGGSASEIGGLAADLDGNSYVQNGSATGAVSGGDDSFEGGLIGENGGTVNTSYATGAVSGGLGAVAGGLTSLNIGTVDTSYATGAVTAGGPSANGIGPNGNSIVGGSVGGNTGTLSEVYSTGMVTGGKGAEIGGLVGDNENTDSASIASSYFDTDTSGVTLGVGGSSGSQNGATGRTTAQLQGALPNGFDSGVWGTGSGLYPYFLWQYPSGTPQYVAGNVFSDGGMTKQTSGTVSLDVNGVSYGSVTPGANGYYYFLVAPGALASDTPVALYSTSGTLTDGARIQTLDDSANLALWGNTLIAPTLETTLSGATSSTLQVQDATLVSDALGGDTSGASTIASLGSYGYLAGGDGFTVDASPALSHGFFIQTTAPDSDITIDSGFTVKGGKLQLNATGDIVFNADVTTSHTILNAGGDIEQTAGSLTADNLAAFSGGDTALNDDNYIGHLQNASVGGGSFSLTDAETLQLKTALDFGDADVSLTTVGDGSNIAIENTLATTGTMTLVSSGMIKDGSGGIAAGTLTGSSALKTVLTGDNEIAGLGDFSTSDALLEIESSGAMDVTGTVDAGAGNVNLTALSPAGAIRVDGSLAGNKVLMNSSGTIGEGANGSIAAAYLLTQSDGNTTLDGANMIDHLVHSTTGDGDFALTDAETLILKRTVDASAGDVTLTTTGAGHNISLGGALSGGTVTIDTAGKVGEATAAAITANLINVTAATGIRLTSALNDITAIGTDTTAAGPNLIEQ